MPAFTKVPEVPASFCLTWVHHDLWWVSTQTLRIEAAFTMPGGTFPPVSMQQLHEKAGFNKLCSVVDLSLNKSTGNFGKTWSKSAPWHGNFANSGHPTTPDILSLKN